MVRHKNKLVTDDDGHWYIIPAIMEDAFTEWLNDLDLDDFDDVPTFCRCIDGPHVLTFDDYDANE